MINGGADLHIHSYYSDGFYTPVNIIQQAIEKSIRAISITDHDTVQGVEETLDLAGKMNIMAIPACEISTMMGNREVHILGYHLDWRNVELNKRLEWLCQKREQRVWQMAKKLVKIGINIHADDVFSISGKGSTGRMHVAMAIIKKGYETAIFEVFKKYIGYGKPGFVPKTAISPEEAIELILLAKGIPVYAHPGLSNMDQCILKWKGKGLQGLEVYHSSHSGEVCKFYEQLAIKYNLCITGGSDFHGMSDHRSMGMVRLPFKYVEKLNQMKAEKG